MSITSQEHSQALKLQITKDKLLANLAQIKSLLGNPAIEPKLDKELNNGKLHVLPILLFTLSNSEHLDDVDIIQSHIFMSDYINLKLDKDVHSFKFLAVQMKDDKNKKIIFGGEQENFRQLARIFVRGGDTDKYMREHMQPHAVNLGGYAQKFLEICQNNDCSPDFLINEEIEKLKKEKILASAVARINNFSFTPNIPINPPDFPYTMVPSHPGDCAIHQFSFETNYESLCVVALKKEIVQSRFFTTNPTISHGSSEAKELINTYAHSIGIKKSIPAHINILFEAPFKNNDTSDDYENSFSLFTITQENVTRYFIDSNNYTLLECSEHDFLALLKSSEINNFLHMLMASKEKLILNNLIIPKNGLIETQESYKTLKI